MAEAQATTEPAKPKTTKGLARRRQQTDLRAQDLQVEEIERVLIGGDLSVLNPEQRITYYRAVCDSVGLNPLTNPFEYIILNKKLTLYAKRDATDQLRRIHNISVTITNRQEVAGVFVVTAKATMPGGRTDESIGACSLLKEGGEWKKGQAKDYFKGNGRFEPMKPDDRANAMMKAETKSKRRVTLCMCGLGMLDENELETIPAHAIKRLDEQGKPIDEQPAPPDNGDQRPEGRNNANLLDDQSFRLHWLSTLQMRPCGCNQQLADGLLSAIMRKKGKAELKDCDLAWRGALIAAAANGTFDNNIANPSGQKLPDNSASDAKQKEKPKPAGPPDPLSIDNVPADQIDTAEKFMNAWNDGCITNNWDSQTATNVMGLRLVAIGKRGKLPETPNNWRRETIAALRAKAIDPKTGKIIKPKYPDKVNPDGSHPDEQHGTVKAASDMSSDALESGAAEEAQ